MTLYRVQIGGCFAYVAAAAAEEALAILAHQAASVGIPAPRVTGICEVRALSDVAFRERDSTVIDSREPSVTTREWFGEERTVGV